MNGWKNGWMNEWMEEFVIKENKEKKLNKNQLDGKRLVK